MWTKRILLLLPILVVAFLLQSFFWVPSYDQQVRLTPDRLEHYISASIGDAQLLNPILNADSASSSICEFVFEGLIDRDENLNWRGRLATSWEITEEAFFVVDPKGGRTPEEFVERLRAEQAARRDEDSALGRCLRNIAEIAIEPAATLTHEVKENIAPPDKDPEFADVVLVVNRPPRIKLSLRQVDQDVFETLAEVLGEEAFAFDGAALVEVKPAGFAKNRERYAAEFLPATEHNPVILFHLRKGVKFHDGHEFDSGDVKFTYDAIMNPKNLSPRVPDYEPVKSVEAVDRYTVRVVYKRLYSPAFGTWGMGMLPEHLLSDEALAEEARKKGKKPEEFSMRDSDFNRRPLGCGPFRFVDWKSDQYIHLVRFDDYWEGAPEYKKYTYRVIPDMLTQEMEFYAGAVDSYGAQPHQVARLKKDDRFQNFSGLSFGYTYIGYNMRRELFQDKRVRRALGMAIDVGRIIKYVLYDEAERITGPFVKQTDYYDHSIEPLPYDPAGAARLLEDAGWKRSPSGLLEKDGKPFRFTLITNNGNPIRASVLTIAQDSWKKLGIDCRTETIEWAVFIEKYIDQGDFDACVLGWSMGIDPDLYQIWHSSQTNPYQLNFVAFKNEEADDLIIRIRQEYDLARQVALCHKLHRIIADEQPYTFLYVGRWTALLDKRIFRVIRNEQREVIGYRKIAPTKTGNYTFHFNQWRKLPEMPERTLE